MRCVGLATVLLVTFAGACGKTPRETNPEAPAPESTAEASDRDRAQGAWRIANVQLPKEVQKGAPGQKEIDDTTITVTGDGVTLTVKDDPAATLFIVFTEDATKSPQQVDFIATEGANSREPRKHEVRGIGTDGKPKVVSTVTHPPLRAIYKFEKDARSVAFALDPDTDRPTEFKPAMVPRKAPQNRKTPVAVLHLKKK